MAGPPRMVATVLIIGALWVTPALGDDQPSLRPATEALTADEEANLPPGIAIDEPGAPIPWRESFDPTEFESRIVSVLTGRYAGLWLSGVRDLNVGVVDPTPGDRELVSRVASEYGGIGIVVPAAYSEVQLEAFMAALDPVALASPPDVFLAYGVDPTRDRLRVELARDDPETIARIRQVVPQNALDLRIEPGVRYEVIP